MPERRFPRPDADFSAYINHYDIAVDSWWAAQGLNEGDLDPLKLAVTEWKAAFAAHTAAVAAAESAKQRKDAARRAAEAAARPITAFIQSFPKTTDAERATIGITVRDPRPRSVPAPTSRPLLSVESGQRLTHRLRLADESTPTRRARPRGASRAEVYVALTPTDGAAPTDPRQYRYAGSATDGVFGLTFDESGAGRQAHYLARWISPSGEPGAWSETASATVAA